MAPDFDPSTARLQIAARTLALDAGAVSLAAALERAGIGSILLKGPSVARFLYGNGDRSYVDIDLLVSEADLSSAERVIGSAGFEPSGSELALPYGRRPHAATWIRTRDGVTVDLHTTLPGVASPAAATWTLLAATTEPMTVGTGAVRVLTEPARAMHVALHAAHHGIKDGQAIGDLARAVAQLPEPTWCQALELAEKLDAVAAFGAGLRLTSDGARIADDLDLPLAQSVEAILRADSAPELALSLDWLIQTRGLRARTRLVGRKLVPPASVLRGRSSLARRGAPGLGAAYLMQPLLLASRALPAVRAWRAARRRARGSPR
ncbi:MAG: nucleotidyltransferase family protein [Actinobacteria bacterium]|nr:nucleotidyltransferase family protein [Actinomycetota bacterium]